MQILFPKQPDIWDWESLKIGECRKKDEMDMWSIEEQRAQCGIMQFLGNSVCGGCGEVWKIEMVWHLVRCGRLRWYGIWWGVEDWDGMASGVLCKWGCMNEICVFYKMWKSTIDLKTIIGFFSSKLPNTDCHFMYILILILQVGLCPWFASVENYG